MGNLREEVKKPTNEEKRDLYRDVLITMLNSGTILSFEEIQKRVNKNIGKTLSQDEAIAIYNLASQLQKYSLVGKFSEKIFNFLKLGVDYHEMDIENLVNFINATVQDIEKTRKYFPNAKWQFQINKIFDRMEGKDPYEDEMKYIEFRKENIQKIEK